MTVAQVIENWTDKFLKNKVPEADDSIKHILTSVLGLKNVITNFDNVIIYLYKGSITIVTYHAMKCSALFKLVDTSASVVTVSYGP